MKYKAILLDIDNTLYNYETTHRAAIESVFEFVKIKIEVDNFEEAYINARSKIHLELSQSASSHNRLLYFQRACEFIGLNPLGWAIELYNIYWDTFLDSIKLYDGVLEFLEYASNKYKICFLTDLTAFIQFRKIKKLKFDNYVSHIVSSEEAGIEKPHPYIFLLALYKLDLKPSDVCMIGDSYKKDIVGSSNLGINSIWLNTECKQINYNKNLVIEIKEFKEIFGLL